MKKLQDMDIEGKKVVLRCDFNVPIKDGKILDNSKILASLETIEYLQEKNCKIVILSHLGKIKTEEDKAKNTLEPVANALGVLLQNKVIFSKKVQDINLPLIAEKLKPKEVLLLENTRYMDLPNKLESNCDAQLSNYFASLGDVFVMDAFGSAHRKHASTFGITKYIPSCIGFLIQKEIAALNEYVISAKKPFTIIMGGAKADDKLSVIKALLPKCEHLLLSGGLANTCLKTLGFEVGESLYAHGEKTQEELKQLLIKYKDIIELPVDAIVGNTYDKNYVDYKLINKIAVDDVIYDIGTKTVEKYSKIINKSTTVFVNGTVGVYEDIKFSNGTKEILNTIASNDVISVIGGGDSVSACNKLGFASKMSYLSTGGGATLEYLATGKLAAIDFKEKSDSVEILDL